MPRRQGNNPKRRLAPLNAFTADQLIKWSSVARYEGSGHHKRNPLNYGLERTNPRPDKSLCDGAGAIKFEEALALLQNGLSAGMISRVEDYGWPKFVWAVSNGVVYEAKTDASRPGVYHGYPLPDCDPERAGVMREWMNRCP
jgi:hypothetical protein